MRSISACFLALFIGGCDAAPLSVCTPSPNEICGITRPEDIELVPQSRWALVSELGGQESAGRILAVDLNTQERRVLYPDQALGREDSEASGTAKRAEFPQCGPPPLDFRPRGFHLSRGENSDLHLLVIAGTRVERFLLNQTGDEIGLSWQGCVDVPTQVLANDVAGFANGDFVVSHMFDPPRTFLTNLLFLLGLDTGYVMAWSAESGWARIPNSDVSFANGIQTHPEHQRIYVSSMFSQRVVSIDRNGDNRSETERLPAQVDNLSWSNDGALIGVGHTGVPVYGISACRDIGDTPCSFPFAVIAIDPITLEQRTLFATGTGTIPGASVAVLQGGKLFLGTAYGDRITQVNVQQNSKGIPPMNVSTEKAAKDSVEEIIWAKELAIFAGRAQGNIQPYIDVVHPGFLAWAALTDAPVTRQQFIERYTAVDPLSPGEEVTLKRNAISIEPSLAIVYFTTHRTRRPGGEAVDEYFENIHVWSLHEGDWKVIASMSREVANQKHT